MSRLFFYLGIFIILASIESSVISAFNSPWNLLPILVPVAIWLYHQKSSRIGIWYLLAWGIWGDVFSLSSWSVQTVVALVLIAVLSYASGRVFSHRSLYGLGGLGFLCGISWIAAEALFRFTSRTMLSIAFDGFVSDSTFIMVALLIELLILFQLDERFRRSLKIGL